MRSVSESGTGIVPADKRARLAQLLRERARPVSRFPLSMGQQALWVHQRLFPQSAAYNVYYTARIDSEIDIAALKRSFAELMRRHPTLRMICLQENGKPFQQVQPSTEPPLEVINSPGVSDKALLAAALHEAGTPFDLEKGPLAWMKVYSRGVRDHLLLFCAHHITVDFWSVEILLQELEALYGAEATGEQARLPELTAQYADFVRWQEEMVQGPEGEKQWEYWKSQLQGDIPALDLPADFPRPPVQSYRGDSYSLALNADLVEKLRELGKCEKTTPFTVLLAAYQAWLHRYTGQKEILVGSPMAGRRRGALEKVTGYFINPVALRAVFEGDPTFRDLLAQVRRTVLDALAHQDYPFPLLAERLGTVRDPSRTPLFQAALFWDQAQHPGSTRKVAGNLPLKPIAAGQRGAPFDLTLTVAESGDGLVLGFQYSSDLFERQTIARMAGHFQNLLEGMVADPGSRVSALPLLSERERHQILVEWNKTGIAFSGEACIHRLIEDQAMRTPDTVAVSSGDERVTYFELSRRSNRLAHYLLQMDAHPGMTAGICLERSADMVIALLAVLKTGAAYVPLDPNLPRERLAFMLQDSGIEVLLTQRHLLDALPGVRTRTICLDTDQGLIAEQPGEAPQVDASPESLAYVIYTSGSTGQPKGVQIPHRALSNFVLSMQREPGISSGDTLLAVTPLSFDIAALEVFLPLSLGAGVVIAGREEAINGPRLLRLLNQCGATVMQATPATWRMLVNSDWEKSPELKILCGGETLPRDLADQLLARGKSVWNLYGPTETTIWSSICEVRPGTGQVPLGHPIANTQLYLLDTHLQAVPVGVAGELCIGGVGLARGYRGRPELTAEKFIPDPFSRSPGARLYRTGDLARYHPDGTIEFLGRMDHQVKIQGHRIELGEVESVLSRQRAVKTCVVVDREGPGGQRRLVAYLERNGEPTPNHNELRTFLKETLPDYMIPAVFVFLDALPLTPHGKVNRKALPDPDPSRPDLERAFVAPKSRTEMILAEIWQLVLGINRIGLQDNFFDLGGASIQSLEVCTRAREAGIILAPEMIFRHPTIAELAGALDAVPCQALVEDVGGEGIDGISPPATHDQVFDSATLRPAVRTGQRNTIIESLGTYLPSKRVTTDEVIAGCKHPLEFPLEKLTGIHERRIAGETEFAFDLALKAAEDCLSFSRFQTGDVDLLICANISRQDGPGEFSFEPCTAVRLKAALGFDNALAFDISNACTGMFTAIAVVDSFLRTGAIRCGMVVSGEYISHLTATAQKEMEGFLDSRLACLTLGDAGAAMILESAPDDRVGFHALDLYTLGRYADLCIAKATDRSHGGAIMYTDSIRQNAVAVKEAVRHSARVLRRFGWTPESFQHILMHQTSETALRDAAREINQMFGAKASGSENTIINLAERGNTATTTHALALRDSIRSGRIQPGDRLVFGITGSGQTIGAALYTFDDLPSRLRQAPRPVNPQSRRMAPKTRLFKMEGGVAFTSMGTADVRAESESERSAVALAAAAAEDCLQRAALDRRSVELLIHCGVFREEYLCEPALAALIAGRLQINAEIDSTADSRTFVFDVLNSGAGFLNACHLGAQFVEAGSYKTVLVTASEIENNASSSDHALRGIRETGSAAILRRDEGGDRGFGAFAFASFPEHLDSLRSFSRTGTGGTWLAIERDPAYEEHLLESIPQVVLELLESEGLKAADIHAVFPPQMSSSFTADLVRRLRLPTASCITPCDDDGGPDWYTSSLPCALRRAFDSELIHSGETGLFIQAGAGIQVGCALYRF